MKNIKRFNDWEKSNEGFFTGLVLTAIGLHLLVNWLGKILLNKYRRRLIGSIMPNLKVSSIMKYGTGQGNSVPVLNIGDYGDRYFISKTRTLFGVIPSLRILKEDKILIYEVPSGPDEGDHIKIPLTDEEYQEFMKVIELSKS